MHTYPHTRLTAPGLTGLRVTAVLRDKGGHRARLTASVQAGFEIIGHIVGTSPGHDLTFTATTDVNAIVMEGFVNLCHFPEDAPHQTLPATAGVLAALVQEYETEQAIKAAIRNNMRYVRCLDEAGFERASRFIERWPMDEAETTRLFAEWAEAGTDRPGSTWQVWYQDGWKPVTAPNVFAPSPIRTSVTA